MPQKRDTLLMERNAYNPHQAWIETMEDPNFRRQATPGIEGYLRRLVTENFPTLLLIELASPMSLATVLSAKKKILEHYARTNAAEEWSKGVDMPPDALRYLGENNMADVIRETHKKQLEDVTATLQQTETYLDRMGLTEEAVLSMEQGLALNASEIRGARAGAYTLGHYLTAHGCWRLIDFDPLPVEGLLAR